MPKVDKAQLLDGLDLTDEQRAAMDAILASEKNQETFAKKYLAQADYSRKMDEAARKDREADEYYSTLREWEQTEKARLEQGIRQTQELAVAREQEASRYRQLLLSQGVDPDSVQGERMTAAHDAQVAQQLQQQPKIDTSNFISRNDIAPVIQQLLLAPAELADIQATHRKLFPGQEHTDWTGFAQKAVVGMQKGQTFKQVAEQEFKFSERAAQLEAEAREAEIQRRAQEMLTAQLSQMKIPTPVTGFNNNSTVFSEQFKQNVRQAPANTGSDEDRAAMDDAMRADQEFWAANS